MVTQNNYYTENRWESLIDAKEKVVGPTGFGTVGAVARDKEGNLAAATSKGGLTNKPMGRGGDSPIIGACTYANNESVAVSATGTGEVFIRGTAAADISALVQYQKLPIRQAASKVVKEKLLSLDGTGDVIAIDNKVNLAASYSSPTMFYGYVTEDGQFVTVLSLRTNHKPYFIVIRVRQPKVFEGGKADDSFFFGPLGFTITISLCFRRL